MMGFYGCCDIPKDKLRLQSYFFSVGLFELGWLYCFEGGWVKLHHRICIYKSSDLTCSQFRAGKSGYLGQRQIKGNGETKAEMPKRCVGAMLPETFVNISEAISGHSDEHFPDLNESDTTFGSHRSLL